MSEQKPFSAFDKLKKFFESKESTNEFSNIPLILTNLFETHYSIINEADNFKESVNSVEIAEKIDLLKSRLEENVNLLLEIISQLTGRQVIVHIAAKNDTIWKISKKYEADIQEICDLNQLKNIILLEKKMPVLIPLK